MSKFNLSKKITINSEDIDLYLLNGQSFENKSSKIFKESYDLWKKTWKQTFFEQNGSKELFSDQFSRQHKIASLFYRGKCVSMIFFYFTNMSYSSSREDSYFRAWPEEAIGKLVRDGNKIIIGSNITVHEHFRGPIIDGHIPLKNLTLDIGIQFLLDSDCAAMTGTMRCDRGMNTIAFSCGARLLQPSITFHNGPVDLVSFYKKSAKLQHPVVSSTLWNSRLDLDAKENLLNVA